MLLSKLRSDTLESRSESLAGMQLIFCLQKLRFDSADDQP